MTPAEQAARIWEHAQRAARELTECCAEFTWPYFAWPHISLGCVPERVLRELATVSGGRFETFRSADDESSMERVHFGWVARVGKVELTGSDSRPATAADESIPLRGGRA